MYFGNVVDKQGPYGASVVGGRDGPVALLAGRVPNLRLDRLLVHLDAARGKLDTNRRLWLQVELVARESRQQIALADARVANEHNWKIEDDIKCGSF